MNLTDIVSNGENVTVYKVGDRAIKAYKLGTPKSVVFKEAAMFAVIGETTLPTPEIHGVTQLPDGRWAIEESFIEGQTLLDVMREQSEEYDELVEHLVEIQMKINEHVLSGVDLWRERLEANIQSLNGRYGINGVQVYRLLTMLDGMPRHTKLCHGNLGPENIIMTSNDDLYIVDWASAVKGNASAEAANTYLKLCNCSTSYAQTYLSIYCNYTAVSKRYVTQWLPIMAASQLAEGTKSKLQEKLLLTWVDV